MRPGADYARWWLASGRGDLANAGVLAATNGAVLRGAAFHAHLAAEKAFKAVIALAGHQPPYVHNLVVLREIAAESGIPVALEVDVTSLNDAAVGARYPDADDPPFELDEIERLIDDAATILDAAERILIDAGLDTGAIR